MYIKLYSICWHNCKLSSEKHQGGDHHNQLRLDIHRTVGVSLSAFGYGIVMIALTFVAAELGGVLQVEIVA